MTEEYTKKQWEEEMKAPGIVISFPNGTKFAFGTTLPCPKCGTVGFYGPRIDTDSKKYRACKFCGWWQEVQGEEEGRNINNGEPYRCRHFCCDQCKEYGWTMTDNPVYCSKHHEMKKIDWASDDPSHPFHRTKEQMDNIHRGINFPNPS